STSEQPTDLGFSVNVLGFRQDDRGQPHRLSGRLYLPPGGASVERTVDRPRGLPLHHPLEVLELVAAVPVEPLSLTIASEGERGPEGPLGPSGANERSDPSAAPLGPGRLRGRGRGRDDRRAVEHETTLGAVSLRENRVDDPVSAAAQGAGGRRLVPGRDPFPGLCHGMTWNPG